MEFLQRPSMWRSVLHLLSGASLAVCQLFLWLLVFSLDMSLVSFFSVQFLTCISFIAGIFLPWHHLAYFCCTPALLLIVAMIFLPDTPSHLARKGQTEKATKALAWLRGTSEDAVRCPPFHTILFLLYIFVRKDIASMTAGQNKKKC